MIYFPLPSSLSERNIFLRLIIYVYYLNVFVVKVGDTTNFINNNIIIMLIKIIKNIIKLIMYHY